MMKLFRKIRKKLIDGNKIRSYLMYAVGEIILVVIGILIALAINNNNQNSIKRNNEQTYLIGLQNEFKISKLKLQELILVNSQSIRGAKKIIEHISTKKDSVNEKEFSEILFHSFAYDVAFNPNNSLLNEMINSGSLKDISNVKLRMQLTNWISTMEDIAKQENDLGLQREKVLDLFRRNENSLRTILDLTGVAKNELGIRPKSTNISNLKLLHSTEFENNVLMFIITSHATGTTHYKPLMEDLDIILNLINSEIKE